MRRKRAREKEREGEEKGEMREGRVQTSPFFFLQFPLSLQKCHFVQR
jgi:hypothetical protein